MSERANESEQPALDKKTVKSGPTIQLPAEPKPTDKSQGRPADPETPPMRPSEPIPRASDGPG